MNRNAIALIALSMAAGAMAGDGLDAGSMARLRSLRGGYAVMRSADGTHRVARRAPAAADATVGGFLTLAPGYTEADLEAEGVTVTGGRRGTLLVRVPVEDAERIAKLPAVASLRLEREVTPRLDRVRASIGVDRLHNGEILDVPYTGKGVLCAAVDGGFDPNHLMFRKADGTSRIENFTYFRPTQYGGAVPENYGPEYMPNIDTESSATFHGTHTLGIMAGGYRGKVKGASIEGDLSDPASCRAVVEEIDNPYYGIAYDADIAIASGVSTDYYVAQGIEEILNFAYERQKALGRPYPVVINLSMGSNVGPHDGTGMLSRYLDEVLEETYTDNVICVASGNEGDMHIAAHKTLAEGDVTMSVGMKSFDYDKEYPNVCANPVYIYSDSEEPFELQALVYNKERGSVIFRAVANANAEGTQSYFVTDDEYRGYETDVVSSQLAQYFEGYIGVAGMIDKEESGRYFGVVDPMLWETPANRGQYVLVIQVKGTPGQKISMYGDGMFYEFGDHGMAELGIMGGTADGSVSDTACGRNTVIVGSYNTRDAWANIDGSISSYDLFTGEEVSPFSSWGVLNDGRELPHVCAPGATVISSTNEYYIQDSGTGDDYLTAVVEQDGRRYSWHQCVGTSMSAPVVSGAVALWKEADPTLRYSDVQDIIAKTSRKDADVTSDPAERVKWGAGKFDAYAGMLEVLRRKGIDGVTGIESEPGSAFLVKPLGSAAWHVMAAGASALDVKVYAMEGTLVTGKHLEGTSETVLDLSGECPGIYLLNINGVYSKKIIIKQ